MIPLCPPSPSPPSIQNGKVWWAKDRAYDITAKKEPLLRISVGFNNQGHEHPTEGLKEMAL